MVIVKCQRRRHPGGRLQRSDTKSQGERAGADTGRSAASPQPAKRRQTANTATWGAAASSTDRSPCLNLRFQGFLKWGSHVGQKWWPWDLSRQHRDPRT